MDNQSPFNNPVQPQQSPQMQPVAPTEPQFAPVQQTKKPFKSPKKLILIIGALLAVAAIGVAVFAIIQTMGNKDSADLAVSERMLGSEAFFADKDGKFALFNSSKEERITEYLFDEVGVFLDGAAMVKIGSNYGIIRDDGKMTIEADGLSGTVRQGGSLYSVSNYDGKRNVIINGQGDVMYDEGLSAKLNTESSSTHKRVSSTPRIMNSVIEFDGTPHLMSVDGKKKLTELDLKSYSSIKTTSSVSNKEAYFAFGNYAVFRDDNSTYVINNKTDTVAHTIDTSGHKTTPIPGIPGSDKVALDSLYTNLIAVIDEDGTWHIIRGDSLAYKKTKEECQYVFTGVLPSKGAMEESVFCLPRQDDNSNITLDLVNTSISGHVHLLGDSGEIVATGTDFYSEKDYLLVTKESVHFYRDGELVKTLSDIRPISGINFYRNRSAKPMTKQEVYTFRTYVSPSEDGVEGWRAYTYDLDGNLLGSTKDVEVSQGKRYEPEITESFDSNGIAVMTETFINRPGRSVQYSLVDKTLNRIAESQEPFRVVKYEDGTSLYVTANEGEVVAYDKDAKAVITREADGHFIAPDLPGYYYHPSPKPQKLYFIKDNKVHVLNSPASEPAPTDLEEGSDRLEYYGYRDTHLIARGKDGSGTKEIVYYLSGKRVN